MSVRILLFSLMVAVFPHAALAQVEGGDVSASFKLKARPLIRAIAAEFVLRFPEHQKVEYRDMSPEEIESFNRVRFEALRILKALPAYEGLFKFTDSFVKTYADRLSADLPQSPSQDRVLGWAMAYQYAYGRGRGDVGALPPQVAKTYYSSLKSLQNSPAMPKIEDFDMSAAERIWLWEESHKEADKLRKEAQAQASKSIDCQELL